ncbi:hypothetical protein [Roseisolibacter sp. H3M3-2]|uniref:hypothetical protein n=1 Tax=Roseisolibacter sp. H3M3-2 TaxID=3031323 RepID=UPI0023DC6648|nr:hypothetical protein [Roseisolibacter sp. H3M3-2]MDF1503848.1 hypothetical protein [Roseisolibacter sp. H3M3-2]
MLGSDPAGPAELDAEVYDALIDAGASSSDTVYVADSTLRFEPPTGPSTVPSFRAALDALPAGLLAKLAEVSATRRAMRPLALRRPMRLFSEHAARRPRDATTVDDRRLPRAGDRIVALSPVARSADGQHALVYYEASCGPRCSSASLAWLARETSGRWKVRRTVLFWIT